MKKQFKNLAAATTLAVGLGAAANAATVEEIPGNAPPPEDVYSKNIFIDFNMRACTADSHTLAGKMRVYPSVSDVKGIIKSGKSFDPDMLQNVMAQELGEAWYETVSGFSSDNFKKDATQEQRQDVMDAYKTSMENARQDIEDRTGITIQGFAQMALPKPGC